MLSQTNTQQPKCRHCGAISVWHKMATGRGWSVIPWCRWCDRHPTGSARPEKGHRTFYPKAEFSPHQIACMPIRPKLEASCSVCGTLGPTEGHHLAPRALFGEDSALWPVVEVCTSCHDLWHQLVWRA